MPIRYEGYHYAAGVCIEVCWHPAFHAWSWSQVGSHTLVGPFESAYDAYMDAQDFMELVA